MNYKTFYGLLIALILFSSCSNNPLDISVPDKDLNINYIHLDSIFVHTPVEQLKEVISKQGFMPSQSLDYELAYCLNVGSLAQDSTEFRIKQFVNEPFIARVEKHIHQKFPKLDALKEKINDGFLHLNYHFPKKILPKNIVFMNSLFASNVFSTENEIAVGLERYLGTETDVIKELPEQEFFQWIKDGMKPEFLERDVLTAWIYTHYVPESKQNTADAIVRWGKIIYLTEAAFPEAEKNIIIRYSKEDYAWALENEYSFWKYLVDEKLLFSSNERDRVNFLNDAPFTVGLPEKGPDRLGQFLGWRMIQSYMEQYPETTLEQLLKLPYNTILQEYEVK